MICQINGALTFSFIILISFFVGNYNLSIAGYPWEANYSNV